jgi:phosphohistidine phosphatase
MIELYLIRHGLAGEFGTYPNDNERPLTEDGIKKTRLIANRLIDLGLQFDLILTSPLVRAKQTADILVEVGLGSQLQEVNYLALDSNITAWLSWLSTWVPGNQKRLALVGHEPTLSTWAELLAWGEVKGAIKLKKAGIIALSLPESGSPIGQSTLFWLTPPRFLLG